MEVPTRNLCAQIPIPLHEKVRENQQKSGKTLSEYVTWLITTFYEGGQSKMDNNIRTLAIQLDAELFGRLDDYLRKNGLKKKAFITGLIRRTLDDAENRAIQSNEVDNRSEDQTDESNSNIEENA